MADKFLKLNNGDFIKIIDNINGEKFLNILENDATKCELNIIEKEEFEENNILN